MAHDREEELFERALQELRRLDRDAMWEAKVGNGASADDAGPDPPDPPDPGGAAEDDDDPAPPRAELLAEFEELLAGEEGQPAATEAAGSPARAAGGGEARYRAVRVGESPVDVSPLPSLARPREAELRDLASGRREIDRRVDLHGKTVAASLRLLRDELGHARELGLHYLLIVTGRGLRSQTGARLRPAVQGYLVREGREHVLWFEAAPPRLGGTGAFVVRLRRPGREREQG